MGTTKYGQSGLESNGNKGRFHIPETARLVYNMQFNVKSKTINDFKGSYLTLIILSNIFHLFAVKWFKVLVCISDISIQVCECNGHNVPGHSRCAWTCLACRAEARNWYGCLKHHM